MVNRFKEARREVTKLVDVNTEVRKSITAFGDQIAGSLRAISAFFKAEYTKFLSLESYLNAAEQGTNGAACW